MAMSSTRQTLRARSRRRAGATAVNCSNNKDPGEKQVAGGGTERVTEDSVDGFIESKGTSSTNEYSEDKEMEQSGTIDSFDKSSDCSSSKEKPNDLDTGVDGNK
ncbi:hypothetical protein ElyMa_004350200 [Elysia marginata]|uniref:Uncharacterized protein n=1 Tax=Elysia marginata TaxID=1093978 RepID=A0AAV4H494_9GAST|nr:hypothetical protein ElyMa_004350200 [Elysia marginata]